jgi:uncharacterized membrane protein YjfL (UPF0719 family)
MSAGEVVLTLLGTVVALVLWIRWYLEPARLERLGAPEGGSVLLRVMPILCIALLFVVLRTLASHDVQDDPRYLAMYSAMGAAWVAVCVMLVPLVGLHVRDDVHERGNAAAAYATAGALLGLTLAFAGGNIGDGPGWWVVVFAAALATAALYLLWALLEKFAHVSEHVTVERDPAAGVRLAGFLTACGLILGRAVAGDWVSTQATIADFGRVAAPALGVLFVAIPIERYGRPTTQQPIRAVAPWGALPALLYVGLAAAYVAVLGVPE